tara:strand:+ start:625 stop:840 length:216 start_codon:yes stop_codon:yes gene_type:complete
MTTFYERKLYRIIKALQADLPNVKLYATETNQTIVRRLVNKRDNLQEAKGLCIWRVGSDGLNKLVGEDNAS